MTNTQNIGATADTVYAIEITRNGQPWMRQEFDSRGKASAAVMQWNSPRRQGQYKAKMLAPVRGWFGKGSR